MRVSRRTTHLVVELVGCAWELDFLLEAAVDGVELLALGPVVEGAGDEYLIGWVIPGRSRVSIRFLSCGVAP